VRGPNKKATSRKRQLRRDATDAETKLWLELRDRRLDGFKFTRQVRLGPYIADFVCRERKLVVELDGGQHAENARDQIRDAFLTEKGYRIVRFWNNDLFANREGVLETILAILRTDAQ
jgi:very-short-patch-repair endonuclease